MDVGYIKDVVNRYGIYNGLFHLSYRAAHRLADFILLKAIRITVDSLNPGYLEGAEGFETRFLTADEVRRFSAADPEALPADFVDDALSRQDECYGIVDGDVLAAFGWYSNKPTMVDDELRLHFSDRYFYMYKGFTAPAYRGKRLHGIGMARALKGVTDRGFAGLVSQVETNNFASLKSCYRMGYSDVGRVAAAKVSGRWRVYATPGCRQYGIWIEPVPAG